MRRHGSADGQGGIVNDLQAGAAAQIKADIEGARDLLAAMAADAELQRSVAAAALACVQALRAGGKVLICGYGGSAADAQHLAGELVSRFHYDRAPLAALALTTDTSALTAIGNDYGYEQVFERQVRGLGRAGDLLIGISTSGRSPNVLRALQAARALGMVTVGMTGDQREAIEALADHCIRIPSRSTPKIQEGHIVCGHALCALIERQLFPRP
ncbi:MAG: D-sedoheptulose 7-phosphate isomerase [Burkholderiales bacterium]|nr:D-sedoheptulose 7-phosphate isomerase [Burkholderiales bacterium]